MTYIHCIVFAMAIIALLFRTLQTSRNFFNLFQLCFVFYFLSFFLLIVCSIFVSTIILYWPLFYIFPIFQTMSYPPISSALYMSITLLYLFAFYPWYNSFFSLSLRPYHGKILVNKSNRDLEMIIKFAHLYSQKYFYFRINLKFSEEVVRINKNSCFYTIFFEAYIDRVRLNHQTLKTL